MGLNEDEVYACDLEEGGSSSYEMVVMVPVGFLIWWDLEVK